MDVKDISTKLKEFKTFQGYFLSDKRALDFIKRNVEIWDHNTLAGKLGVLGLGRLIPDLKYGNVLARFLTKDVKQGILEGDLNIFGSLLQDLPYLNQAKFIVSRFLCAHRPDYFPIWDESKCLIAKWHESNADATYEDLKEEIDEFMTQHELIDLDYFYFNKLLWYCE